MQFSIIIPFHKKQNYIKEAIDSCLEQTVQDFEIVLVPNGDVLKEFSFLTEIQKIDPRIKMFPYNAEGNGKVGALKRYGFFKAQGEWLVELDWDDLLTPDCLETLQKEFKDHPADFYYSNCAHVNQDWSNRTWSTQYGWEFRDFDYKGHKTKEAIEPLPYVSNLARIWYAPNHVRVWNADFYRKIGGHNPNMKISDDHDIVARSYLHGTIYRINKCLYIYRVHGDNTWLGLTKEIEETMWDNYLKYIFPMINKWAEKEKLLKIDLCGGINKRPGYTSIDLQNADIIANLEEKWPFEDNSVGVIYANDAVEHMKDPIHTMNEAHRVLAHGGFFMINVPSTSGPGAFCDPTHKSFWNIRSFRYYTESGMRRYIEPACTAKFQVMRIVNGTQYSDKVPYVFAHLIALKDGGIRFHGTCDWMRERTEAGKNVDLPYLSELALKYGSDKCPAIYHSYTPFYQELLDKRRLKVKKVLEIGVGFDDGIRKKAASLYMWRDYFPNATIYGCDILREVLIQEDRIKTFYCDQKNVNDLEKLISWIGKDFDLVVDDGSHETDDQICSAMQLLPVLSKNGIYVIEDVKDPAAIKKVFEKWQGFTIEVKPFDFSKLVDMLVIITKKDIL
jgi:glycosyltransferase involved in cell wall biosynthesis